MTRRDYEVIAKVIRDTRGQPWEEVLVLMTKRLEMTYANFNKERFLKRATEIPECYIRRMFKPGDIVLIECRRTVLIRRVNNEGGWKISPPILGCSHWNEEEMELEEDADDSSTLGLSSPQAPR